MSALLALALLSPAWRQETVQFRVRPPLGEVMEFALAADAERPDGTSLFSAQVLVAQRVKAEGPNFRFSRYVSHASAQGAASVAKEVKQINDLAGKTFPLLISPTGEHLPFNRRKFENAPREVPSFAFPMAAPVPVGKTISLGSDDLQPGGEATLREVRELGAQRAAIFAITGNASEGKGSGTIVVSVTDGLLLLVDLTGELKAEGAMPAARIHLAVRRKNVPGLDRLAAELNIGD